MQRSKTAIIRSPRRVQRAVAATMIQQKLSDPENAPGPLIAHLYG
jgi:hypothetical protein